MKELQKNWVLVLILVVLIIIVYRSYKNAKPATDLTGNTYPSNSGGSFNSGSGSNSGSSNNNSNNNSSSGGGSSYTPPAEVIVEDPAQWHIGDNIYAGEPNGVNAYEEASIQSDVFFNYKLDQFIGTYLGQQGNFTKVIVTVDPAWYLPNYDKTVYIYNYGSNKIYSK